jgi:hypothetical protein
MKTTDTRSEISKAQVWASQPHFVGANGRRVASGLIMARIPPATLAVIDQTIRELEAKNRPDMVRLVVRRALAGQRPGRK